MGRLVRYYRSLKSDKRRDLLVQSWGFSISPGEIRIANITLYSGVRCEYSNVCFFSVRVAEVAKRFTLRSRRYSHLQRSIIRTCQQPPCSIHECCVYKGRYRCPLAPYGFLAFPTWYVPQFCPSVLPRGHQYI